MHLNKRGVHILKDPRLRKIRYNLRSILFLEYQRGIKIFLERREKLDIKEDRKEISYREWRQKIIEIKKERLRLHVAFQSNPICCIRCGSRQNDLEKDEESLWVCKNDHHELNDQGLSSPRSPFNEKLIL
ncbi:MAG: hypothetical protein BAJALOKI2v1_900018 [Promethearchaeota archaeon]|nr:MAG: hypothetical protein BAJALOKI2v1_900018 [Candidatus Lokiarchaeota archaeon]